MVVTGFFAQCVYSTIMYTNVFVVIVKQHFFAYYNLDTDTHSPSNLNSYTTVETP